MRTSDATGLSREQRQRLETRGLVRLEGLIPRRTAEEMADRLWAELARKHGARRGAPETWRVERPQQFKSLSVSGAFKAMATPAYRAVLDDLMGAGHWEQPPAWGQPLVCFPSQTRWDVPHKNWHLDLPANPNYQAMMLGRLFAILAPLKPRGGGTLVATGSHRIAARLADKMGEQQSSSMMRKRMQTEHRWFHDLMSPDLSRSDRVAHFMGAETDVDGIPCQVEEITGEPGDVFLMHPAALHTLAPNVLDQPRLVLAQSVYPKSWFG